jgi:hypothetical protein
MRKKANTPSNSRLSTEAVLMSPICVRFNRGSPECFTEAGEAILLDVVAGAEVVERTEVLVLVSVTAVDCGGRVEPEDVGTLVHLRLMIHFIVTSTDGSLESGTTVGVGRTFTTTSHQGASDISGAGAGVNANGSMEGGSELVVMAGTGVKNATKPVFVVTCVMTVSTIFGGGFMFKVGTITGAEKGTGPTGDGRVSAVKGIGANNGTPGLSDMMTARVDV